MKSLKRKLTEEDNSTVTTLMEETKSKGEKSNRKQRKQTKNLMIKENNNNNKEEDQQQLLLRNGNEQGQEDTLKSEQLVWRNYQRENLDIDYTILFTRRKASYLLTQCEAEIVYNKGKLAQVRIFGKWIDIPRKQVAFGDDGLTYTFSGNTVPALPWTPLLSQIRDEVSRVSGYDFNFVLVNRYANGYDYMGEHKDDEKDLLANHPIASVSLGQTRDFVFRHQDCRSNKTVKGKAKPIKDQALERLTLQLESGSLLLMKAPTNSFWYHSLPKRTKALGVRLNLTFRKMVPSLCKPVEKVV